MSKIRKVVFHAVNVNLVFLQICSKKFVSDQPLIALATAEAVLHQLYLSLPPPSLSLFFSSLSVFLSLSRARALSLYLFFLSLSLSLSLSRSASVREQCTSHKEVASSTPACRASS
jgi:hypothetical protein